MSKSYINWNNVDINNINIERGQTNNHGFRYKIKYNGEQLIMNSPNVDSYGLSYSKLTENDKDTKIPQFPLFYGRSAQTDNKCAEFIEFWKRMCKKIEGLVKESNFKSAKKEMKHPLVSSMNEEETKRTGQEVYYPPKLYSQVQGYFDKEKGKKVIFSVYKDARSPPGKNRRTISLDEIHQVKCRVSPRILVDSVWVKPAGEYSLQVFVQSALIDIQKKKTFEEDFEQDENDELAHLYKKVEEMNASTVERTVTYDEDDMNDETLDGDDSEVSLEDE